MALQCILHTVAVVPLQPLIKLQWLKTPSNPLKQFFSLLRICMHAQKTFSWRLPSKLQNNLNRSIGRLFTVKSVHAFFFVSCSLTDTNLLQDLSSYLKTSKIIWHFGNDQNLLENLSKQWALPKLYPLIPYYHLCWEPSQFTCSSTTAQE